MEKIAEKQINLLAHSVGEVVHSSRL